MTALLLQVLFWLWSASEVGILLITRTRRSSGEVRDRGSLLILWLTILLSIAAAFWAGAKTKHDIFPGASWVPVVSLLLFAAGLAIRWTAIATLGRSFSANVAIHAKQTLRTNGLFRYVRHPSYTGILVIFTAIGVATRSWLALAIMIIFPMAALLYRIHVEEAALSAGFGRDYANYCAATKRLIPGVY